MSNYYKYTSLFQKKMKIVRYADIYIYMYIQWYSGRKTQMGVIFFVCSCCHSSFMTYSSHLATKDSSGNDILIAAISHKKTQHFMQSSFIRPLNVFDSERKKITVREPAFETVSVRGKWFPLESVLKSKINDYLFMHNSTLYFRHCSMFTPVRISTIK